MIRVIKKLLRESDLFMGLLHRIKSGSQNRRIIAEQQEYEARAAVVGFRRAEYDPQRVFSALVKRLAEKGIPWPPKPEGRRLRIVFVTTKGNWERDGIPPQLEKLGDLRCFFLDEHGIPHEGGARARAAVAGALPAFIKGVQAEGPIDLILSYLSASHISPETIAAISGLGIPIFVFNLDDRYLFRGILQDGVWSGMSAVCAAYDLSLTNAPASMVKYVAEGGRVLFWPEGANPEHHRPLNLPFEHDVSFVGARYGVRPALIGYLRRNGIRVACYGPGWENGMLSSSQMIELYAKSRIVLGLGYVCDSSDQCLKGRDFEVPMSGAVYLTTYNDDLPLVYKLGVEIETYESFEECLKKIRLLLADPARCARMRSAAREAGLARHTWVHRVRMLLEMRTVDFTEDFDPEIARGKTA
jgi:hypothetical protein